MTFRPKITLTFSLIERQAVAWREQACQSEADRPRTLSQEHSACPPLMPRTAPQFGDGAQGRRSRAGAREEEEGGGDEEDEEEEEDDNNYASFTINQTEKLCSCFRKK